MGCLVVRRGEVRSAHEDGCWFRDWKERKEGEGREGETYRLSRGVELMALRGKPYLRRQNEKKNHMANSSLCVGVGPFPLFV